MGHSTEPDVKQSVEIHGHKTTIAFPEHEYKGNYFVYAGFII